MIKKKNIWVKVPEVHKDIVKRLSEGFTATEIAEQRERSYNTVRTQIAYMTAKYGCKNTTQLTSEFIRRKIIE